MPCQVYEDFGPSQREQESKKIIDLLIYVFRALGKPIPADVAEREGKGTTNPGTADRFTQMLCLSCKTMEEDGSADKIIYDGRNAQARQLAEWWQKHQEEDAERLKQQELENRHQETLKQAYSKLTLAEIHAIKKDVH